MTDERRPHTIFFDVGGTLLRAFPSVGEIYVELAARHGIAGEPREVERRAKRSFFERKTREREDPAATPHTATMDLARDFWREVVRDAFGSASDSPRFEAFFDEAFAEFARHERYATFPEVEETLSRLEASGHRLGIVSNWDERLRPILDGMGLLGRFGPVAISGEVKAEKPSPEIFRIAREMAGAGADDRLILVGDSPLDDVEGARAGGFEPRLVRRGGGGAGLLEALRDLL